MIRRVMINLLSARQRLETSFFQVPSARVHRKARMWRYDRSTRYPLTSTSVNLLQRRANTSSE